VEGLKTQFVAAEEAFKAVSALCDEAQMKALAVTIVASGKTMAEVIAWIKGVDRCLNGVDNQ
jgi:hypothetical protein